ncbi:hypothetical protein [Zhongshania sp.]|jgi:hypothetical protein|uniref:hypothetical protein n=1 Tax=Zhongshania sp. TaxID=1971902 RepID=UPI001B6F1A1C|nr:hypothetical protein [Zhongshania sp.]MBQ0794813.1 hypothetical protein [Zhongshania sp.]|tara:strand:- start:439 stop:777 length:339 start_codon:yes stop_codon:yes gene_type:complete
MRFLIPSFLFFTLCGSIAHASCVLPLPPQQFPDGAIADAEAMEFAKRRVERYFDNSLRYIKCLDTIDKTAIGTGRDNEERKRKRINSYNVGLENIAMVLAEYEESVRQFNSR